MAKAYPKIRQIHNAVGLSTQYYCEFCSKAKTDKRIDIAVDDDKKNDLIIFCHATCIRNKTEIQIIATVLPGVYDNLIE